MASNYTEHYGLCQWETTDQVLRREFNEGNMKIDNALDSLAKHAETLETSISHLGNCKIICSSYIGNGRYDSASPNTLTFESVPELVLIVNTSGRTMFLHRNSIYAYSTGLNHVTWSGTTVSWYITSNDVDQFNERNQTYRVYAFFQTK